MIAPHQIGVNILGRVAALCDGADGQILARAGAIAPGPDPGKRGAPGPVTAILPPASASPSGGSASRWPMADST
jgi:hypothetical protein